MPSTREDQIITFENSFFPLEVIKRALYRFAHRASFDLRQESSSIHVIVNPHEGQELTVLKDDIRNEVLDQDLRAIVADETSAVRNLILANAFSKTGLIDN